MKNIVKKIAKLLDKRNSVPFIMGLIFLTKVVSFFKLRAMSSLGATTEMDLFNAAFWIPDTIFSILIAGSVAAAVIPTFSSVKFADGLKRLNSLFVTCFVVLVILLISTVSIVFLNTQFLAQGYISSAFIGVTEDAVSYSDSEISLLVNLIRILLLSPIFMGMSALISAYLQVRRKFFITNVASFSYAVFTTVGMYILGVVMGYGVIGFAVAVAIASFAHLCSQIPVLVKTLEIEIWEPSKDIGKLWEIIKLGIPRVFTYIIVHLSSLVNNMISLGLQAGALSIYNYALALHKFPPQIIAAAIGQVALPDLSEKHESGDEESFKDTFNSALRNVVFFIIPCVVVMVVLRVPIVRLVFEFEQWDTTVLTAWCLGLLSVSVLAQSIAQILLKALFAIKEVRFPLIVSIVGLLCGILFSFMFTRFLGNYNDWRPVVDSVIGSSSDAVVSDQVGVIPTIKLYIERLYAWFTIAGKSKYAVGGLALSFSLVYLVEVIVLGIGLQRRVKVITMEDTIKPIARMFFNGLIMLGVSYMIFKMSDFSLNTTRSLQVVILFISNVLIGACTYAVMSLWNDIHEFKVLLDKFHKLIDNYWK